MNTKSIKSKLTAAGAICTAAFLFAACEPRDEQPGVERDDPDAPAYGEPDRPMDPAHDPATTPQQDEWEQEDQWGDDTGTTN